jgi:hypothetical protein
MCVCIIVLFFNLYFPRLGDLGAMQVYLISFSVLFQFRLFVLFPMCNSVATIILMTPYRKHCLHIIKKSSKLLIGSSSAGIDYIVISNILLSCFGCSTDCSGQLICSFRINLFFHKLSAKINFL